MTKATSIVSNVSRTLGDRRGPSPFMATVLAEVGVGGDLNPFSRSLSTSGVELKLTSDARMDAVT